MLLQRLLDPLHDIHMWEVPLPSNQETKIAYLLIWISVSEVDTYSTLCDAVIMHSELVIVYTPNTGAILATAGVTELHSMPVY